MSLSDGTLGGIKEAIVAVRGPEAYGLLRRESGVHRVQRVPATETQGRIHTSAATVAVLPEAEEVDVKIEPQGSQDRRLPLVGPGRPEREHHRQRGPHHPSADRRRRQPAGPEIAAPEQDQGDGSAARAAARPDDRGAGGGPLARSARHGGHRRPLGQDPHLQLSPEPGDRPPDQPLGAQPRRRDRTATSTSWSRRCAWPAGRSRMASETGVSRRHAARARAPALLAAGGARRAAARGAPPLDRALRRGPAAALVLARRRRSSSGAGRRAFAEAVRRRAAGEPLAHVTGPDRLSAPDAPERPPRADPAPRDRRAGRAGAGARRPAAGWPTSAPAAAASRSSLATEGRYQQVVGIDLSRRGARRCASENRALTGAPGRARPRRPVRAARRRAASTRWSRIPPILRQRSTPRSIGSVRDWEPALALGRAERTGWTPIARLLDAARAVVRPGGWLALEIDCARAAHCAWRAGAFGWTDVAIHADLFGRERYLLARRSDAP